MEIVSFEMKEKDFLLFERSTHLDMDRFSSRIRQVRTNHLQRVPWLCFLKFAPIEVFAQRRTVKKFSIWNLSSNYILIKLTRYLPSPTWKTRNFCRHVHSITSRRTSSWTADASHFGSWCHSGLRATRNSSQSMTPSFEGSNMSATAWTSWRFVGASKNLN